MHHITKLLQALCLSLLFIASAQAQSVNTLFHHAGDPVAGNPRGSITLVEFFDYQCGHCVSMSPVVSAMMRANPDLRVVFKELPIRGPMSHFASRAALAANKQGKYLSFSHALMNSNQPLTESTVMQIAKNVGLNVDRLKKDMSNRAIYRQLSGNAQEAQNLQVTGTPAFFIGKTNATNLNQVEFILGAMSSSELQSAINKAKNN